MKSEKRMFISFILNLFFTVIEFVGGIISNSVALLSDSIHDLGDSVSMGIAIFLERKSKKKPDQDYTYGYHRFSLLGALISSIILLIGSSIIIFEAVNRLLNPETINTEMIIYFAIFGVIVNGAAALNLKKGKSMNEKVISLHLLEDVLGWLALLIAAIVMHFTNIIILDALLSLAFTIYIIYHVIVNLKKIFLVFLEAAPKGFDIKKIKAEIEKMEPVVKVHHMHLWSLEGSFPLLTMHVVLKDEMNTEEIAKIQNEIIHKLQHFGVDHSTIQMEFKSYPCLDNDCLPDKPLHSGHHHHH